MSRKKKSLERFYVETSAKLLSRNWDLGGDREVPDFVIEDAGARFGLEVTEVYTGPVNEHGAVMKRQESLRQKRVRQLQEAYEVEENIPLNVQLVGDIGEANLGSLITEIRMLELPERQAGYQARFEIDEGDGLLSVYVAKALRPDWLYVDDGVGWVNLDPRRVLESAIAEKATKLDAYRDGAKTDDIRLLIVANRIQNSGKLKLEGPLEIDQMGFSTVYFLSYPEAVHVLGSAGKA